MISTNESTGLGFHQTNQTRRCSLCSYAPLSHTRSKLLIHISAFLCVFMRYTRFLHETESRRQRALRGNVLFLFYFFRIKDARYNLRKQNQHASKYFCLNYYFLL